jgi:hypothetical protein
MTKGLCILGSTGSIGRQCLSVVRQAPDRFHVVALCGGKNVELLAQQAREFAPQLVVVGNADLVDPLRERMRALAGNGLRARPFAHGPARPVEEMRVGTERDRDALMPFEGTKHAFPEAERRGGGSILQAEHVDAPIVVFPELPSLVEGYAAPSLHVIFGRPPYSNAACIVSDRTGVSLLGARASGAVRARGRRRLRYVALQEETSVTRAACKQTNFARITGARIFRTLPLNVAAHDNRNPLLPQSSLVQLHHAAEHDPI